MVAARDEEPTVGRVVLALRRGLIDRGRAHELVVIDSDSRDGTADAARAAGAAVVRSRDIRPDLGTHEGKGEALWKAQFVTSGDVLLFVDADLEEVPVDRLGDLVTPFEQDDRIALVKARYDRVLQRPGLPDSLEGGRLTALTARPIIRLWWPELDDVEQPLAGEWAIRRETLARLHVPVGYGVELAALLDVHRLHGRSAIAQADLGRRVHRHRSLAALGETAGELLAVAAQRLPGTPSPRHAPRSALERPPAREVGGPVPVGALAARC